MSSGASYLGIGVDFDAETEGAVFPLGSVVKDKNGNTFMYVKVSADLTADLAYIIEGDFEVKTALVYNNAKMLGKPVCFPTRDIDGNPTAKYTWVQIAGKIKATFAADTNAGVAFYSCSTAGKVTGTSAANEAMLVGGAVAAAVDVSEEATGQITVPSCLYVAHAVQAA